MVGLVRNIITNEPQAIHRTAIDANGRIDRKALGPIGGGAVEAYRRCGRDDRAGRRGASKPRCPSASCPVWSKCRFGRASRPAIWPSSPLPGVESVWIAADNDASGTGQRAAETLARRLDGAGIEPVILLPRKVGTDLNDKAVAHV